MLIILNYKDGEICVTFDEINNALDKEKNPDDINNHQSSSSELDSEPSATRTRDPLIKSQMLYRLS